MDDEAEIYKLWRLRKTVMALCHDRGYLVSVLNFKKKILLPTLTLTNFTKKALTVMFAR